VSDGAQLRVIGVGSEFRGDDGAGPAVISRLGGQVPAGTRLLICDGEPTALMEAWDGAQLAIVVDAVGGGSGPAGTLHRMLLTGTGSDPGALSAARPGGRASWHGPGVRMAADLGRVLGRLPEALIVHGVEASDFAPGVGLSPPVAAAVSDLCAAVLADLFRYQGQLAARQSGRHQPPR